MSNIKLTCFGCGCELQNTDPNLTGYTPKPLDGKNIFCQRCYRLQHYGENVDEELAKPNYKQIFSSVLKKKGLIVYVVDLFQFEISMIPEILPFLKEFPVLVIANKRDILPKSVKDDKLKEFVYRRFKNEGIEIKDVICVSAYKNYNIDEIVDACSYLRQGKDIYIVGASSVGKSSLINAYLKNVKNQTKDLISTSPYPGTTVSTISIPLDNKTKIYDTPGALAPHSMYSVMEKSVLKIIIPKHEIKPITYQLNAKQSILIGGIAKMDFVSGSKTNFTFYLSNNVDLHRTKLDRSNDVFDTLVTQGKIKPISTSITSMSSLIKHSIVLPKNKVDVVILGLGWININGNGQELEIWAPEGVNIQVREPKI